jgi:DNA invertase Pin-like site-specific DNA recombinase
MITTLGERWAHTRTSTGRLMPAVLGELAHVERDLTRTAEGRSRAKAPGVRLGRRPKLTEHQRQEAIRRRGSGREALADSARSHNVSHSTISKLMARRAQFTIHNQTRNAKPKL